MFGNKSGILSEIARIFPHPKARRQSCEAILSAHRLEQARRKARAQQESYFVLTQYPWCKS